jgi:hypothetical protein
MKAFPLIREKSIFALAKLPGIVSWACFYRARFCLGVIHAELTGIPTALACAIIMHAWDE